MTNYEYKEKLKRWLSSYGSLSIYIESLKLELEAIEATTNRLNAILSLTPKGSGGDITDKWIRAIEKSDEVKDELIETLNSACSELIYIHRSIKDLKDPDERMIMTLRYINRLEWEQVIKHPDILYSRRQVFRIHDRALSNIQVDSEKLKEY